jgi:hypothetical protein
MDGVAGIRQLKSLPQAFFTLEILLQLFDFA